MSFDQQVKIASERFISAIKEGSVKTAEEIANPFLRIRVREDGVVREILEPVPVTEDDFVPQVDTDQPVIIVEKEPSSPGAMTIPFGDYNPPAYYMQGRKFRVDFVRISSRTVRKDEVELATWRSDVKALLAEMMVKDLSWEEDAAFIASCNTLLGGSAGASNIMTGDVQWHNMAGGITRTTLMDAFRLAFAPATRIPVTKILCNGATMAELAKMDRLEVGGDDAQAILYEGWGTRTINNASIIASIKRELIPDDTLFMFGHSNFIGRFYVYQEPSLYIVKEDTEVRFRAHEVIGSAIGHVGAVHRFDYTAV